VFVRLLALLVAHGVATWRLALAVSERAVALRRRQMEVFGAPRDAKVALIEGAP
jgi:hypothetical protein